MKKSLYFWLPKWAITSIKNKNCKKCHRRYKLKDIAAITIREVQDGYCFCVEQYCPTCKRRSITVFNKKERTLEGMCYFILEHIKQKKIAEKSKGFKKNKTGPITDAEAKDLINFIQNLTSHDEMLRQMGVQIEDDEDKS